jgi:hypothetical protein
VTVIKVFTTSQRIARKPTVNDELDDKTRPPLWPVLLVLFGLPLALLAAKLPGLPTAELLTEQVSLANLPDKLQSKLGHILFVPLAATLVVLVRLTLGLRVLGPFRSILLAVAFQITGIALGLAFLTATIAIVVGIRPAISSLRMPYFGRITVMLSSVAVLMTLGVMAGQWFQITLLQTIVYFPMVVLCLVADAFARTMHQEGIRSALWRGAMTGLVAIALTGLARLPVVTQLLIRNPELLIVQVGGIIVISRCMAWRLLERFNPKVGDDEEDEYDRQEFNMLAKKSMRPAALSTPQHAESHKSRRGAVA